MADTTGGIAAALARAQRQRSEAPPQPLGPNARAFSYGASTSSSEYDGPLKLSIRIEPPEDGVAFRSGEVVMGWVVLRSKEGVEHALVEGLGVRMYFESRTLFWGVQPNSNAMPTKFHASTKIWHQAIAHEYHRGIAETVTLEQGSPVDPIHVHFSPDPSSSTGGGIKRWPITLHLPGTVVVDEFNDFLDHMGMSTAPRDLCAVPRPPPPTLRDNVNASVEWIIEATLRLVEPPSLDEPSASNSPDAGPSSEQLPPAFGDTTRSTSATDEKGFAVSAPPNLLITRAVFPFVTSDEHNVPLEGLPMFGSGGYRRAETGGAEIVEVEFGDNGCASGSANGNVDAGGSYDEEPVALPSLERITTASGAAHQAFQKIVPLTSRFLSPGSILSHLLLPHTLILPRTVSHINLTLRLSFVAPAKNGMARLRGKAGDKGVQVEKVSVRLSERTLTRGGKEIRGHLSLRELRREDFHVSSASPTTDPQVVSPNGEPLVLSLPFSLQSPSPPTANVALQGSTPASTTATQIPLQHRPPSFRTPNIEYEFVVTVNVTLVGQPLFCAGRFVVQFVSGLRAGTGGSGRRGVTGSGAGLPRFEVAIAEGLPGYEV